MLYTRKGDDGTSGLYNTKERLKKDAPVYEALGSLDELGSLLGVCSAIAKEEESESFATFSSLIQSIQQRLFIVQAELAGADKTISIKEVQELETIIGQLEATIKNPHSFVLAGATVLSGLLDYARTLARRAERSIVRAAPTRSVSAATSAYMNRLSSALYALARSAAALRGVQEVAPSYL